MDTDECLQYWDDTDIDRFTGDSGPEWVSSYWAVISTLSPVTHRPVTTILVGTQWFFNFQHWSRWVVSKDDQMTKLLSNISVNVFYTDVPCQWCDGGVMWSGSHTSQVVTLIDTHQHSSVCHCVFSHSQSSSDAVNSDSSGVINLKHHKLASNEEMHLPSQLRLDLIQFRVNEDDPSDGCDEREGGTNHDPASNEQITLNILILHHSRWWEGDEMMESILNKPQIMWETSLLRMQDQSDPSQSVSAA